MSRKVIRDRIGQPDSSSQSAAADVAASGHPGAHSFAGWRSRATFQTTPRATLQATWRRLAPTARRASLALAGVALDGVSAAVRRMPPRCCPGVAPPPRATSP